MSKGKKSVTVKEENWKKAQELQRILGISSGSRVYQTLVQLESLRTDEGEKEINENVRYGFGMKELDLLPPYALPIKINRNLETLASLVYDEKHINSIPQTPLNKLEDIANKNISEYVDKVDYVDLKENDIRTKIGDNYNGDIRETLKVIEQLNKSPQFCEQRYNEFLYKMFGSGKLSPVLVKPIRMDTNKLMVASYYSKQFGDDIDSIIKAGDFEKARDEMISEKQKALSDIVTHPQFEDFIEGHLLKKSEEPDLDINDIIVYFRKLPRKF